MIQILNNYIVFYNIVTAIVYQDQNGDNQRPTILAFVFLKFKK